ncbi:Snf7 [Penicillium fimorum]|uniref:Snf7 n=1 Tax=Penicillium fimorum TaxID=1882269 RepID=A0A9W9XQI9_9EURO|nr:Snf7 [Penicillium fimorum]
MSELLKYILTQEEAFRRNRLPSLYSDFTPQKKTNPDGYAVNVAAWEQALNRAAKRGYTSSRGVRARSGSMISDKSGIVPARRKKTDHLILRTDESLLRELESPEWGRPVALGTVFDEAVRKSSMIPLPVYKTTAGLLQKKSQWRLIDPGVLSPWNVMSWGARQLKGFVVGSESGSAPKLQVQELVLVENLQEAADRAVKKATGSNSTKLDLIYSRESFVEEFAGILNDATELSDADFDVLLLYLSRDSGAIAYDGKTIKFKSAGESGEITQQDTTIASIKTLVSTMSKQVTSLEAKIAELNASAKTALANKNRISALSAVRSKKLAEHNLQQRFNTLMQLEEVYSKIEQAAGQVEIVQVMQASTGVLRGLHTQIGGAERVEDIVEELREEMTKVDEVGSIMNEAGPVIDEGEIDDELAAMEKSDREAREKEEAAVTESRLAELGSAKQTSDEASRKARAAKDVESELADNIIDRLSNMSVEDRPMQAN